jgi:hypothetical protein
MGNAELEGANGEGMRAQIAMSAAKRIGTPDDIAGAVEFLVGPSAAFITGTDLLVDGGSVPVVRSMIAEMGASRSITEQRRRRPVRPPTSRARCSPHPPVEGHRDSPQR